MYTCIQIQKDVEIHQNELFEFYSQGRPDKWLCDSKTKEIICLGKWIDNELRRISFDDEGRIALTLKFNRLSRTYFNIYEIAAEIMNDAICNNVERGRIGHRRWG